jgi:hypothetical protein
LDFREPEVLTGTPGPPPIVQCENASRVLQRIFDFLEETATQASKSDGPVTSEKKLKTR